MSKIHFLYTIKSISYLSLKENKASEKDFYALWNK